MFIFLIPEFDELQHTCALQFDQGGLMLQKEQYANKTVKDHKVGVVSLPFYVQCHISAMLCMFHSLMTNHSWANPSMIAFSFATSSLSGE